MKVLLVQPPIEDFYTTPIRLFPLGLLSIGSLLRRRNHEVLLLDCLQPFTKKKIPFPPEFEYLKAYYSGSENNRLFRNYWHYGRDIGEIVKTAARYNPDIIGISSKFTAYFSVVRDLSKAFKKEFPSVPLAIGGAHATACWREILCDVEAIDYVVTGEGEYAFADLVESLGSFRKPAAIPGIRYRKNGSAEGVPDRVIRNWDKIVPDYSLVYDLYDYRVGRKKSVSMLSSRGCPFDCAFCGVSRVFGKTVRYKKTAVLLEEMLLLKRRWGIELFNFEDDNISFNRDWFLSFLTEKVRHKDIRECELTAMNGMCYHTLDEEILTRMKDAGFSRLNLSMVTASSTLLEELSRFGHIKTLTSVIKQAKQLGMHVTVYIILGLPGQTKDDILASIELLSDLNVLIGPSIFYPVPGTHLTMECQKQGLLEGKNWLHYRSSAFPVETPRLSRQELVHLVNYCRERNLEKMS